MGQKLTLSFSRQMAISIMHLTSFVFWREELCHYYTGFIATHLNQAQPNIQAWLLSGPLGAILSLAVLNLQFPHSVVRFSNSRGPDKIGLPILLSILISEPKKSSYIK